MHRIIAALMLVGLCAAPGDAAENPMVTTGIGTRTCGEFAQDYRSDPNSAELAYFTWAQGFMAASNVELMVRKRPVRDLSARTVEAQKSHIRQHCDKRPLQLYMEAVVSLFRSFPLRSTPQAK